MANSCKYGDDPLDSRNDLVFTSWAIIKLLKNS